MENKKKYLLLLILLLLIIGSAFFAFKSCEPRQKAEEDSTEASDTESESETLSDSGTSADSATTTSSDSFDELSAFINANIEFTCEIIKNPALAENQKESETKVNAAYKKYGLPVEYDKQMIEILKKYENDENVISIVRENTKPCKEGGEGIFYKAAE